MMTASSDVTRLVFGLVAAERTANDPVPFDAFAEWIRTHTDVELERRNWPSYRALADSVRAGESDIAWLPPVVYAWIAEGVTPLGYIARGESSSYSAALVTLESSRFHTLTDLRGARAGWVDPWSAAGYVVPRIELARAGIRPNTTFSSEAFYGGHKEALAALTRGDCDIAGTYAQARPDGTFDGPWSDVEELSIRVIASFSSIPSDVIATRRNLAPTAYERALAAFHVAGSSEQGRPLMKAVFGGDELRDGIAEGHDALRRSFEQATAKGLFD